MSNGGSSTPARRIGIDVGGTKTLGVRMGESGGLDQTTRQPTPVGAEAILSGVVDVALQLGAAAEPCTIGLGVAGLLDKAGVIRRAPNLPGLVRVALGPPLRQALSTDVVLENDANCAAVAEVSLGVARGIDDVVVVTLGTGIGAGLVQGGRLQRGAHGLAGEPGHMVVEPHGPPCPCGGRGCWERYASGSGLGHLGREAALAGKAPSLVELAGGEPELVRGEHVSAAARASDEAAHAVLRDFAWWVALGVANLVAILDPEMVVLGGGLSPDIGLWIDDVRGAYADLVVAGAERPPVPIEPAHFGEEAVAVGAGLLAARAGVQQ